MKNQNTKDYKLVRPPPSLNRQSRGKSRVASSEVARDLDEDDLERAEPAEQLQVPAEGKKQEDGASSSRRSRLHRRNETEVVLHGTLSSDFERGQGLTPRTKQLAAETVDQPELRPLRAETVSADPENEAEEPSPLPHPTLCPPPQATERQLPQPGADQMPACNNEQNTYRSGSAARSTSKRPRNQRK